MEYRVQKFGNRVKKKLFDAQDLGYPNNRDSYTINTDASLTGILSIFNQKQTTEDRVIAYASKALGKSQRHYSANKRKILAMVHFTQHFRNNLLCQHFLIITGSPGSCFKEPDGMVARWLEKRGQFNSEVKHRAGERIPSDDCLSRINTEDDEKTAFVNAITMDIEQDNTNYGSQGWQLDKLQRVKLRVSQQNYKLLKEVYSWLLNKKDRNHGKEKWSIKGVMEMLAPVYKSLSLRRDFVS